MQTFIVIKDGTVVNAIIAETLEAAEEATGLTCSPETANIGDVYDPETGEFITIYVPDRVEEPDPALLVEGPKPHELPPVEPPIAEEPAAE